MIFLNSLCCLSLSAAFTKVSHLNSSLSITTTGCPIGYTDRLITDRSLFPSHSVTTAVKRKKNRLLSCKRISSNNGIQNYKHHSYSYLTPVISLQMYKKYFLSSVKFDALLDVKTETYGIYTQYACNVYWNDKTAKSWLPLLYSYTWKIFFLRKALWEQKKIFVTNKRCKIINTFLWL